MLRIVLFVVVFTLGLAWTRHSSLRRSSLSSRRLGVSGASQGTGLPPTPSVLSAVELSRSTGTVRPRFVTAVAASSSGDDADAFFNRPGPWDDKNLGSLMSANQAWASKMTAFNPSFFTEHKKGHAPKILWIGCSDARVPANEIIGQDPGNVFVHRNIANQVVNTDFNCMSVIQYAVAVLKVKHIVVCGHYDCGGVKASLENGDHGSPLENWLRHIRDTYRLHKEELDAIKDPIARQRRLVELNVVEQCLNVFKTAVVQKRRVETHLEAKAGGSAHVTFSEPQVHAFVYEPTTGLASKLDVDFKAYLGELKDVYDLYKIPEEKREDGGRENSGDDVTLLQESLNGDSQ